MCLVGHAVTQDTCNGGTQLWSMGNSTVLHLHMIFVGKHCFCPCFCSDNVMFIALLSTSYPGM